jgi:alpha-N-arabinofuranosidase
MFRRVVGAALFVVLGGAAFAETAQVSVTVDTANPGAEIDRHIYGQFAEHLGTGIYGGIWVGEKSPIPNIQGYRKDVVEALKAIHVPVVRWPGGCFADLYDWRDGIGPRAKRPTRINVRWGGVLDDNRFGTHEFMNFAELIGADAYVSLNVGSLAPLDSAQWVEYMTSDEQASLANERRRNGRAKPWQLKYLGIGNETWGCGGNMNGDTSAAVNARYSTFVNAPASMGMIKVASGATGNGSRAADAESFTEAMMKGGGRLQALSFHYYAMPMDRKDRGPATGFSEDKWEQELSLALEMEPLIAKVGAVMDKYDAQKKVALYVDEWGSWYEQEPGSHPGFLYQQNSLRDAEVAALSLNIFHRHTDRVKLAAIAQMINVLQAMILTDGDKMVLTPTYHVFDMYQPFMGAVPFAARVSGPEYRKGIPMVDVSAARGKDGRLYLSLTNTDPHNAAHVRTNLAGAGKGRILTGPAIDTHNTFDSPGTIHPAPFSGTSEAGKAVFDLPARSVAVVAVE